MDREPAISVAIPVYEMLNGMEFLERSLGMLKEQTFKDFEVVISDDSIGNEIENLVKKYEGLDIRYVRNMGSKGMAENTNSAILFAKGKLIKILYQDDMLAHIDSLQVIAENFRGRWLVTGCVHRPGTHTHLPTWNDEIYKGINTIGSPSVLTILNENPLLFEPKLSWVLDCAYYMEMYKKFGPPTILDDINVIIGVGSHQTTHLMGEERKQAEIKYLTEKYAESSLRTSGLRQGRNRSR